MSKLQNWDSGNIDPTNDDDVKNPEKLTKYILNICMQNKFLCKIYFKYLAFFIYKLFDGEFTSDNGSKSYCTCSNLGTKKKSYPNPQTHPRIQNLSLT